MQKSILNLEIKSPQKLDEVLGVLPEVGNANGFVALNLLGSQILVRQFDLPQLSKREIKNALRVEATEIFSLLPDEIEVDYQVLESSRDNTKGVFVAVPKKLLLDYISRFDKARLTPVTMTASILSHINNFLQKNKPESENFCLIDFYKENIIHIIVFNNGKCQLLREIHYDTLDDARQEIIYSLKYASGKSSQKQFEEAFCLGELSDKDNLIAELERDLNIKIKKYELDSQSNGSLQNPYFKVDLIKNYGFSLSARKKLSFATNIILAACALIFLILSINVTRGSLQIKNLSSTYKAKDYNYAAELQEALNLLKNAK